MASNKPLVARIFSLDDKMKEFGFLRSEYVTNLYVRPGGSSIVTLVMYVNHILLIGKDVTTLRSVKSWFGIYLARKDFGDAIYILCIKHL